MSKNIIFEKEMEVEFPVFPFYIDMYNIRDEKGKVRTVFKPTELRWFVVRTEVIIEGDSVQYRMYSIKRTVHKSLKENKDYEDALFQNAVDRVVLNYYSLEEESERREGRLKYIRDKFNSRLRNSKEILEFNKK